MPSNISPPRTSKNTPLNQQSSPTVPGNTAPQLFHTVTTNCFYPLPQIRHRPQVSPLRRTLLQSPLRRVIPIPPHTAHSKHPPHAFRRPEACGSDDEAIPSCSLDAPPDPILSEPGPIQHYPAAPAGSRWRPSFIRSSLQYFSPAKILTTAGDNVPTSPLRSAAALEAEAAEAAAGANSAATGAAASAGSHQ